MSEENLPTAEEMRARYAHLNDDAPGEAEGTGDGAQGTDDEATGQRPEAIEEAAPVESEAPTAESLEPTPEPEPVEDVPDPAGDLALHLLDVNVRLWGELGRAKLPLSQAVALGTGAIVDLDKEPDDAVDVLVNGLPFAKGRLLLVDGEWAVRLEEIVATPAAVEQASSSGSGA